MCIMTMQLFITGPKLRFPTCSANINMTFVCKHKICIENLALSYRFPTCTKSKFLSSAYDNILLSDRQCDHT